jgi:hypothetical protein
MQIALGFLRWEVGLLFAGMAFAGNIIFVPLFTLCFGKLHIYQYVVMSSLCTTLP